MITDESLEMRWVPNWSDPAHLPAYLQIHLFKNLDCNNNCKILDLILVVKSNSAARTMTKGRQGSYKYLKIKIKRWGDAAGEIWCWWSVCSTMWTIRSIWSIIWWRLMMTVRSVWSTMTGGGNWWEDPIWDCLELFNDWNFDDNGNVTMKADDGEVEIFGEMDIRTGAMKVRVTTTKFL